MRRVAEQFAWVVGISTVGLGFWREERRKRRAALPLAMDAEHDTLKLRAPGQPRCSFSYYVDRSADPGRAPLILVHGIHASASARDVKPLFERYRGQRTVVAVDLPGFGTSDRGGVEPSPALYESALLAVLEREGEGGADVIALNSSSELAARVARAAPRMVRSLAMIAPTGLVMEAPPSRAGVKTLLARFSRDGVRTTDATIYEHLEVPTLVLYDRGPHSDFSRLSELTAKNTHVRAERIAGSGAYPHFDKPEQTCLLLERTWQKVASRRPEKQAVWS